MRLLLDTQAFLYMTSEPARLPTEATKAICDADNLLFLSIASAWEIVVKTSIGKLKLEADITELINVEVQENGLVVLPIELRHLARLERLPMHHRDPFDRLLIAQALSEGVRLVSGDPAAKAYGVDVIW